MRLVPRRELRLASLPQIDFRKLRYFATVAELGSFTKAAQQLHIAQPALSRQVRLLEEDLGLQLMSRTVRGVVLTEAGTVLLKHAHALAANLAHVLEDMQTRAGSPKGEVVIGLPPSTVGTIAPPLVMRVRRDFPMVSLTIREGISQVLANWVEIGNVDIAVLSYPVDSRALLLEPLAIEDIVVFEREAPAEGSNVYSLGMLAARPLLVSGVFATIAQTALQLPTLKLNVLLEIDSVEAMRKLVLQGFGAALLPVSVLREELGQGLVHASAITSQGVRRTHMLARPALRQSTRALEAVVTVLKEEIAALERDGYFALPKPATAPAPAPTRGKLRRRPT